MSTDTRRWWAAVLVAMLTDAMVSLAIMHVANLSYPGIVVGFITGIAVYVCCVPCAQFVKRFAYFLAIICIVCAAGIFVGTVFSSLLGLWQGVVFGLVASLGVAAYFVLPEPINSNDP